MVIITSVYSARILEWFQGVILTSVNYADVLKSYISVGKLTAFSFTFIAISLLS